MLIPLAGEPGTAALMTADDALKNYPLLADPGTDVVDRVPARVGFDILFDRPGKLFSKLTMPALVCVCKDDHVTPAKQTFRWLAKAPKIEVERYPGTHFDIYQGDLFERAISDQLAFLTRTVPIR